MAYGRPCKPSADAVLARGAKNVGLDRGRLRRLELL